MTVPSAPECRQPEARDRLQATHDEILSDVSSAFWLHHRLRWHIIAWELRHPIQEREFARSESYPHTAGFFRIRSQDPERYERFASAKVKQHPWYAQVSSEFPAENVARRIQEQLRLSTQECHVLLELNEAQENELNPRRMLGLLTGGLALLAQAVPKELFAYFDWATYAGFRTWSAIGGLVVLFSVSLVLHFDRTYMTKLRHTRRILQHISWIAQIEEEEQAASRNR